MSRPRELSTEPDIVTGPLPGRLLLQQYLSIRNFLYFFQ